MKISTTKPTTVQRKLRGFTLVELMISMTITLVIIGVLLSMTSVAVKGLQKSQNNTCTSRLSQEVLSTITKDLEGIVIRSGNNYEWVLSKNSGISGDKLGPGSEKKMHNPFELSFFSAVTDRYNGQINVPKVDKGGDISMIRYKVIHQDQMEIGGNYPVFAIYRQRVEPKDTFEKCLSQPALDGLADLPKITARKNYLAENIYDLTVSFNFEYLQADGTSGYARIPLQVNGDYKSLSIKGNQILVNGLALSIPSDATSPRLSSADVSLMVLTDKGMNGLKRANIKSKEAFSKYLLQNGRQYSKTVILPRP